MLKTTVWIAIISLASCAPNGVYVTKNGDVGASWGGYSASAGLGGIVSGNNGVRGGLHAEAGTPDGHYAGAGLGGAVDGGANGGLYSGAGYAPKPISSNTIAHGQSSSSSSASASASASASSNTNSGSNINKIPNGNKHQGPSFFDNIFNIPVSVLNSVNRYLNNKQRVGGSTTVSTSWSTNVNHNKPQHHVPVHHEPPPPAPGAPAVASNSNSQSFASSSAQSSSGSSGHSSAGSLASSSASSGSYAGSGAVTAHKGQPNYDQIFDIPRSVLGAVNQFLNGK